MISVHTLMQEAHATSALPARRLGRKEEHRALTAAIERLSEVPRLVLALRHCEGLKPRQIAGVVGLEEEAVRRLLIEASQEVLGSMEVHPSPVVPTKIRPKTQVKRLRI